MKFSLFTAIGFVAFASALPLPAEQAVAAPADVAGVAGVQNGPGFGGRGGGYGGHGGGYGGRGYGGGYGGRGYGGYGGNGGRGGGYGGRGYGGGYGGRYGAGYGNVYGPSYPVAYPSYGYQPVAVPYGGYGGHYRAVQPDQNTENIDATQIGEVIPATTADKNVETAPVEPVAAVEKVAETVSPANAIAES